VGRLIWKVCTGSAPSLRCIGRLQHSVLIKNGRSWRKHLSKSVSRGRSSKDTLLFRGWTWQPLRKAVKGNSEELFTFRRIHAASFNNARASWTVAGRRPY
jgi:hypothetical protein